MKKEPRHLLVHRVKHLPITNTNGATEVPFRSDLQKAAILKQNSLKPKNGLKAKIRGTIGTLTQSVSSRRGASVRT